MSGVTCAEVHTSAAEFAFGLLDGVERARMVAHLDSCASCRRHVEDLTVGADALLLGGPIVEPPAGFEQRVARAAVVQPLRPSRPHALRRALSIAAVALIVLGAGVIVGRVASRASEPAVRSAVMETPDGRVVGRVAVGADPDTVFVALPGWRPPVEAGRPEPYRLRLTLAGGRSQVVGPVHLGEGDGSWGTVLAVDARQVRRVALVGDRDDAYCTGVLG